MNLCWAKFGKRFSFSVWGGGESDCPLSEIESWQGTESCHESFRLPNKREAHTTDLPDHLSLPVLPVWSANCSRFSWRIFSTNLIFQENYFICLMFGRILHIMWKSHSHYGTWFSIFKENFSSIINIMTFTRNKRNFQNSFFLSNLPSFFSSFMSIDWVFFFLLFWRSTCHLKLLSWFVFKNPKSMCIFHVQWQEHCLVV